MNTEKEKVNILETFRKALTAISKIKTSNVYADLNISFHTEPELKAFRITIFDHSDKNTAFYFGSHESQERADARLLIAIDAIKTDNLAKIKEISKETLF